MKKKKISWSNRYKRFFLSEHTALIAALVSILLMPVIYFFGKRSGSLDGAGLYDLLMRLLLICTLFYALKRHKLFLIQAATVGLLFCMLCTQSQYALGKLANQDSEVYIIMGLQGFVFLAVERMLLFIQSFICVSHFIIHAARRQEAVRVSLNQVSILFLLALVIIQLIIAPIRLLNRTTSIISGHCIWMNCLFLFLLPAQS